MSTPCCRPTQEEIKAQREAKRQQEKQLRDKQRAQGLEPKKRTTVSNAKSSYKSIDEECNARNDAVTAHIGLFRAQLPQLLKQLRQIPDPRKPKKIKYSLTLLMSYGLLMFVFQFSSRRQVNKVTPCVRIVVR